MTMAAQSGGSARHDATPRLAGRTSYRPELDGIRAFCIIFTILNHVPDIAWFMNGSVGVDVFFALSGWLITWLLLEERERTGRVDLPSFYIRRLFRIAPLYYLVFVAYVAIIAGTHNQSKTIELQRAWPYILTFNSEYRPDNAGHVYGHAWTLGIEEKFYIVWPALMLLQSRSRKAAIAGAVLFFAIVAWPAPHIGMQMRGYFGLAVGAVLALTISRSPEAQAFLRRRPLAFVSIALLAVSYALTLIFPKPYWPNMCIAASSGILIVSLWFNPGQMVGRFLSLAPLAYAGRLTYAIYLIQSIMIAFTVQLLTKVKVPHHWPIVFIVSYGACIVAAAFLHKFLEKPLQNLGRSIARKRALRPSDHIAVISPSGTPRAEGTNA